MNSGALIDRLNFAMALANGKLGGMRLDAPLLVANGVMETPLLSMSRGGAGIRNVALVSSRSTGSETLGEDRSLGLMERALVAGELSPQTNRLIEQQLASRETQTDTADPTATLDTMAAMILGSPEFQLH
jgi:hypothetical protein